MLLQTASRGWELGLLVLVLAGVGLVSYWVYRDAAARGMADAPYWGAAVGVATVVGVVIGGVVAAGVYLSARPEEYAGGERPFDAFGDGADEETPDPAHADLPPVPELTAERVENASETTLRGYARRYDRLDATGEPAEIRAALAALVAADETEKLGETVEETERDHRRDHDAGPHAGRPLLSDEGAEDVADVGGDDAGDDAGDSGADAIDAEIIVDETEDTHDTDDARGFEWVEST